MYQSFSGEALATVILFLIVGLFLLAGVVLWVLQCIALYVLSQNRGMSGAGLAWIPGVGSYRIGSVSDDISKYEGSKTFFGVILLSGAIISNVLSGAVSFRVLADGDYSSSWSAAFIGLNVISGLMGLAIYVIQVICLNNIYRAYRPPSATTWTVLSAIPFTSFLAPIFLFMIRNNAPQAMWRAPGGYPPGGYAPQGFNGPQGYAPYSPPQPEDYYAQPPSYPAPGTLEPDVPPDDGGNR